MKSHGILIFSLAVAAALAGNAANAADYDPPIFVDNAPEYVPVEVGSGWYLRGDLGYNFNKPFKNTEIGPSPIYSFDQDNTALAGSIGAGYHFNDFLRGEINLGFLSKNDSSLDYLIANDADVVISEVGVNAKNEAWSGMVNAYADLGTYVGLTPYIGAGVGAVYSKRSYTLKEDIRDPAFVDVDFADKKSQVSFAYSLNAGVAYQLSKNIALDVGYQYLAAPSAQYVEMTGLDSYRISKGIDYHQLKVGLRYDLW
ncbi:MULTISPECIES: outer membrane protein [unclassified Mesorhizobium]|uniref:outer membrane protein n=1 Tax=unclassified Mesorhizobium TaxID=325217 RepID=UPI0030149043